MRRKSLGSLGEEIAEDFLTRKGYKILEKNYRCREGEIDIVAEKDKEIVFVEVRTRKGKGYGIPEETITEKKKEKMKTVALHYLATHPKVSPSWRIDFIAIEMGKKGEILRIELIEGAV